MSIEELLKISKTAGKLKTLKRKGWVRHNVKNSESVADHSYRAALLAFVLSKKTSLNREKAIIMALTHDLAESIVGDITPFDGISKELKHQKELAAMKEIAKEIDNNELVSLFEEYLEGLTLEAKFVKELDNLELMIQAYEYEKEQKITLQEFWDYAKNYNFSIFEMEFKNLKKLRGAK